jgi:regulator of sigma E protease
VLAVIVMSVLAFHYGRSIYPSTVIGAIRPPAGLAGLEALRVGDTLHRVNGHQVSNWNEVRERILASRDSVAFETNRGTATVRVPATSVDTGSQVVANALVYYIPPVIDSIVPNDRAANAGFLRGDSIIAAGGQPVRSWTDMVNVVSASPDKPLNFTVYRPNSGTKTLVVVPRAAQDTDPVTGKVRTVGKIGAAAKELMQSVGLNPFQALSSGTRATWSIGASIVGFLHDLIVGHVSIKNLGGPVTIARASVTAARNGIEELFYLIALLSVNVAILNLLPIPILDGGQIVINVVESAKGSPFSLRTREYILRFGLIAIALLFAVVMYNDTRGGLAKLFGWVAHLFG